VGVKPILDMVRLFGCAVPTGVDLPGEQKGFIADPAWKEKTYKQKWMVADTILTTIGQGYVLMTPIQLVTMIAQVANGGYRVVPHIHKARQVKSKKISLNIEHVKLVLNGLYEVVNTSQGTAYTSRLSNSDFHMGGKTGTAQVRRISMQERQSGVRDYPELPWHLRDNSLFVGFAPTENPRYAVAVVGQHEGWGSGFAARTSKAIMEKLYQIEKNRPSKQQVKHEL
jgi:penicillin-binding protein 2